MSRQTTAPVFGTLAAVLLVCAAMGFAQQSPSGTAAPPKPAAPAAAPAPVVTFVDVTRSAGIDFKHTFGDSHMTNIVEATGSGAAFFDFDNDGDQDLYVVNGTYLPLINDEHGKMEVGVQKNQLYKNDGTGKFANVTDASGLGDTGFGMSAAVGDYDNDGWIDVYVANFGPNALYHNNGDGTFSDVTAKAGVAGPEKNTRFTKWTVNAQWVDYDVDGDLDLYVGNYLEFDPDYTYYYLPEGFPGPEAYLGQPDLLYRNNGDGTFTDGSKEAGIHIEINGKAMGVGIGDFDLDGLPDVFVANDAMEKFLFRNLGGGKFKNVAIEAGVAFGQGGENVSSMHPSIGDVDNNGLDDVFVSDMTFNALFKNLGGMTFEDKIKETGVASTAGFQVSWGGGFLDYDNDGDLDIFIASGGAHHLFGQQAVLWKGEGNGKFQDVSRESGDFFKTQRTSRGAAWADIDNDGDLDLFVVNIDLKFVPTLMKNEGGNAGRWLTVRVVNKGRKRDAYGARLKLTAGGQTQYRTIYPGTSYLGQSDVRAQFGLGRAAQVDSLEVTWPGVRKPIVFKAIKPNQIIEVEEGVSKVRVLK